MQLTLNISKDEEFLTKDKFGLYLAKKSFMKKLIEIEIAEKIASSSKITEEEVEELSDLVKKGLYENCRRRNRASSIWIYERYSKNQRGYYRLP